MSALKRSLQQMPEFVVNALNEQNLTKSYLLRMAYQRNKYIGWINRTKREATKLKKPNQMLGELCDGEKNMGMEYKAKIP